MDDVSEQLKDLEMKNVHKILTWYQSRRSEDPFSTCSMSAQKKERPHVGSKEMPYVKVVLH